jgi:hypothetical protein
MPIMRSMHDAPRDLEQPPPVPPGAEDLPPFVPEKAEEVPPEAEDLPPFNPGAPLPEPPPVPPVELLDDADYVEEEAPAVVPDKAKAKAKDTDK